MAWHAFLIEGNNYRTKQKEASVRAGRVGFYTWRFVDAETEQEALAIARKDAETAAEARFAGNGHVHIKTLEDLCPSARPPQMTELAPGIKGTGFILFPETPLVAEIAGAMEGFTALFGLNRADKTQDVARA